MTNHRKYHMPEPSIPLMQSAQQICVCYDVYSDEISQAIQNGADSVEQISELTYACLGCGSCRLKIEAILERENA